MLGALTSCSSTDATPATPAISPAGMNGGHFVLSFKNARFVEMDVETGEISAQGAVKDPERTEILQTYSQGNEVVRIAKYEKTGEKTATITTFEMGGMSIPERAESVLRTAPVVAAKVDILTAEQIGERLSNILSDGAPTYHLTFTSSTTAKACSESLSGCTEYKVKDIDVTFVPAAGAPTPAATSKAALPNTLDGVWVKLEMTGIQPYTWLYGHQGKLYRLNSSDVPGDVPPPAPTRFTPSEIWFTDQLGRTFAEAEFFSYKPINTGFVILASFRTMRGPIVLGGTVRNEDGCLSVNDTSTVQVTVDKQEGHIISGSCKGYYGRQYIDPDFVSRITIYR